LLTVVHLGRFFSISAGKTRPVVPIHL
jgi:hypothetical protein